MTELVFPQCSLARAPASVGLVEEGVQVSSKLAVVLEEKTVGRVGVDRETRVGKEPGQEVGVPREDHRVAIAVRDEDREVDR